MAISEEQPDNLDPKQTDFDVNYVPPDLERFLELVRGTQLHYVELKTAMRGQSVFQSCRLSELSASSTNLTICDSTASFFKIKAIQIREIHIIKFCFGSFMFIYCFFKALSNIFHLLCPIIGHHLDWSVNVSCDPVRHIRGRLIVKSVSMTLVKHLHMDPGEKLPDESQNLWAIFERFFQLGLFPSSVVSDTLRVCVTLGVLEKQLMKQTVHHEHFPKISEYCGTMLLPNDIT